MWTYGTNLTFVVALSFFYGQVLAAPFPKVLKYDSVASSGDCVIPTPRTADQILKLHNIQLTNASDGERRSLARGLAQVSALNGGVATFASNVKFVFAERSGFSNYDGVHDGLHVIKMNRCGPSGDNCAQNNIAHLMHELGHRVGNEPFPGSDEKFYDAYKRLVGECHSTSYARTNVAEDFAEAFAAYLTYPEILSQGDPGCKRAFEFFARDVFRANGKLASCTTSAKQTLLASLNLPSVPPQVQVAAVVSAPSPRPLIQPMAMRPPIQRPPVVEIANVSPPRAVAPPVVQPKPVAQAPVQPAVRRPSVAEVANVTPPRAVPQPVAQPQAPVARVAKAAPRPAAQPRAVAHRPPAVRFPPAPQPRMPQPPPQYAYQQNQYPQPYVYGSPYYGAPAYGSQYYGQQQYGYPYGQQWR